MKKRILVLVTLMVVSLLVIAACGNNNDTNNAANETPAGGQEQQQPTGGQEQQQAAEAPPEDVVSTIPNVVFAVGSLQVSLDPIKSNDSATAMVSKQLYDTLLAQDYITFEVYPNLAVEWDLPDAQTVNMRIRDDVYFHNGDKLTAHDVAFSLERAGASPQVDPIVGMIESVTVHDDYNFTINLEIPFAPILRHLAHPAAAIVPMNHMNAVGEDAFAEHPIGSGPFSFVSHTIDVNTMLARNSNWWGGDVVPETLEFRRIPDQQGRLLAVEAGEVHVAEAVAPGDVARAEASSDVNMMRRFNLSTNYVGFNTQAPHISNPLVRQAINYALDTQAVVDMVFMGTSRPANGPISNLVWGFYDTGGFPTNLDRARELMVEAGYADGFSTTIWYNAENAQRQQIAEMVQFALLPLGIEVEVIGLAWGEYLDRVADGEHDMFLLGWVSVTGDADYGLYPLFHSDNYGAPGNRTFWSTPRSDELLMNGRMSVDPAERLEIYRELQILLHAEAPWIFINQGETLIATAANVNGFVIAPAGHHQFRNVWGS
jgi:peptide/nickel transport system substrate-binding protein